ncbi:hypothetical protein GCM10010430_72560 [Kitasatospora cystarginea]|uniref:Uncharacterized protein n=1 Tax=Kitasatospora cystarginea TaxID=58350 RepID=A0ABN3EXX8_9ACTN
MTRPTTPGTHRAGANGRRQAHDPLERAVPEIRSLGRALVRAVLGADGEDSVIDGDRDLLRLQTGKLGVQHVGAIRQVLLDRDRAAVVRAPAQRGGGDASSIRSTGSGSRVFGSSVID